MNRYPGEGTLATFRYAVGAACGVTRETIVTPENLVEWERGQARKCGHVQTPSQTCRVCRDTQTVSDCVWATGQPMRVLPCK